MGEDTRAIEGQIEDTRERMGDTVAALSYKADVPGRMKDSVSDTKDAVTDKLSSAKDVVMGSAGDAASGAEDGSKRVIGIAQENPLGLAIGAVAAGFVVGSLLPGTRVEEERIGPAASKVREQVTEVASEAVEHGKQVAHNVAGAAADAANQSGHEHADQLRESAQDTLRSDS
jgi:gas vesicle protein